MRCDGRSNHNFMSEMYVKQQQSALQTFSKKYRNGSYTKAIVSAKTIEDLWGFSKRNAIVFGYCIAKSIGSMVLGDDWTYDASPLFINVAFTASNVHKTSKEVDAGHGVKVSESSKSSRVQHFHTLHGIRFQLTVRWTYKRGDVAVAEPIVWTQEVNTEPYSRYPVDISFPEPREFELGALFHLAHLDTETSDDSLRVDMTAADGSPCIYPRHNAGVDKIMQASVELQRLVDHHATVLATHVNVSDTFQCLAVPWSVHAFVEGVAVTSDEIESGEGEAADGREDAPSVQPPLVDSHVFDLLDAFHASREEAILSIGNISVLMQRLYLVKLYAVHFSNCFDLIEEQQVRAFLSGIGKTNAMLWEKNSSIDRLLLNVSAYTAAHGEHSVRLKACSDSFTACSCRLEARLPGEKNFSVMHAVEMKTAIDASQRHTINFRGPGDEGVVVVGTLTRRVFVVPTARAGNNLPAVQISAGSLYGQPVLVSIGAMGGAASTGKSLFLLGDGMQLTLALSVAALPSNAAFESSMALIPTEMRQFAASIRAADLGESGLCIDVIEVRPLLAQQFGIKEAELVGRRDKEQQLLNLVKAGASLAAVAATIAQADSVSDAIDACRFDSAFRQVDLFVEAVMEQGMLDQKRKRKHEEMEREERAPSMVYRSLGAVANYSLGDGGGDGDGDGDGEEGGDADGGAKNKGDVMSSLLFAFGKRFGPNDFSACKIDMGNPRDTMRFAQTIMPDKMGGYVEPPHTRDWVGKGADAAVMRDALIDFLEKSTGPVKTTRICYYGMYAHTEPALLKSLLSGGKDPCATQADMFSVVQSTLMGLAM
tara:strand:- start:170 stop:2638 length:2469 start_codon:yes stop_codon:yes gene_type:complete